MTCGEAQLPRLSRALALLTVAAVCVGGSACSGADESEVDIEAILRAHRDAVDEAIRRGELPPVAAAMFNKHDHLLVNFIDGPRYDADVVRVRGRGTKGPRLRWGLDRDGHLEREEREITESELFDAVLLFDPRYDDGVVAW